MLNLADLALAPFNKLVNQALKLDAESFEKLVPLAGKVLAIKWTSIETTVYVSVKVEGVRFSFNYDGQATTTLSSSTPLAFARLLAQPDIKGPTQDIHIEGDPHFAQSFQQLLSGLSIDWEEQLSKLTGDDASHHIFKLLSGAKNWVKESHESFTQNTTEFLQQEVDAVPSSAEVQDFMHTVDQIRNDVERANARIKRLRDHKEK